MSEGLVISGFVLAALFFLACGFILGAVAILLGLSYITRTTDSVERILDKADQAPKPKWYVDPVSPDGPAKGN